MNGMYQSISGVFETIVNYAVLVAELERCSGYTDWVDVCKDPA